MELRIAKVISFIFHPLFIPFYMILFLLNTDAYLSLMISFKGKLLLTSTVFLTTVLLPWFTNFVLMRMKIVQSYFPQKKEERIYLLLNIAIFYYLTYYLLKETHASVVFNYFMLGSTFLVVCSLMITFFYRISLHMIAAGGLTGSLLGLTMGHSLGSTGWILAVIFLAGVTGTARLKTGSEKPGEVYWGFLAGITGMFLLFILV